MKHTKHFLHFSGQELGCLAPPRQDRNWMKEGVQAYSPPEGKVEPDC